MSAIVITGFPALSGSTKARLIVAALALAVLSLMDIFPALDLAASAGFYRPGEGFPLSGLLAFDLVMKALPVALIGIAVLVGLGGITAWWEHRPIFRVTPRVALYIVTSLIVGPGLLGNTLFKDNWGRARPHQVLEFGGAAHFTPVLQIAHECAKNCSFPSGHGALGFWIATLAILAPERWRLSAWIFGFLLGALVGWMRIAQGAHFLSDVFASAMLVVGVNWVLKYLILGPNDIRG